MSFVYSHPFTGLANGLNTMQGGGGIGGWVELGRTTLGGTSDNISVSSLSDKRYYMVLGNTFASGIKRQTVRLNSDTGSNYAYRFNQNGTGEGTGTSKTFGIAHGLNNTVPDFTVSYCSNLSTKEKLGISHSIDQSTASASNAPVRGEYVWKWTNTTDPIDEVTIHNPESGDFASGSEVVVLGWDPSDTHTNNFWQELASANGDGTADFDTGTFTAKKYIWIQAFIKRSSDSSNTLFRVGNSTIDTGSNYSWRKSSDGGADSTGTSQSSIVSRTGGGTDNTEFYNIFIVNNSSNEKLIISHHVNRNSSGAGSAPLRSEIVGKWTNTSNQINIVGFNSGGANTLSATSIVKVWGAD